MLVGPTPTNESNAKDANAKDANASTKWGRVVNVTSAGYQIQISPIRFNDSAFSNGTTYEPLDGLRPSQDCSDSLLLRPYAAIESSRSGVVRLPSRVESGYQTGLALGHGGLWCHLTHHQTQYGSRLRLHSRGWGNGMRAAMRRWELEIVELLGEAIDFRVIRGSSYRRF